MIQSKSLFSYFLRSKGRHGIHSPFVFDFIDTCLTTKVDKNFLSTRKLWYKSTQKDKELFQITDLGAGSKQLSNQRSVAQLARKASSNGLYGDVLWKIAKHYKPRLILELGTSIGTGTIHLKNGYPESHVITVEGCENTLRKAYKQFDFWDLRNVTPIHSSFDDFLEYPTLGEYDLIFIDGHHSGEASLRYVEKLLTQSHNHTLFILDDIRWSDDMWLAWNTLVSDPRFHLSIDLGRMGLLWRREEQVKEHFVVRPKIFKGKYF